jgi:transcriptional regulator with XRE-family HTH domain
MSNPRGPVSRLEVARRRKRLTQRELAKLAGCGHDAISRIERGHHPGAALAQALADALDTTPARLFGANGR